ncbi:MAG: hypothetical protein ABL958_15940 [Bdellovibrionia bacterium]
MKTKLLSLVVALTVISVGCAPKEQEESNDAFAVTAANLNAVQAEYVPESITDTGASTSSVKTQTNDDICAGLDFIQCQPRLIRAYLLYGKAAVAITHVIVVGVAHQLRKSPNNSSGVIHVEDQDITVEYNKRSLLDYDFLVIKAGIPVGKISASPELYNVQLDLNVLDKDKPDSRGGKIDLQVKFTDKQNWQSQITITGQKCNEQKPEDPTNGRIAVTRAGELWGAQASFYNAIGMHFSGPKTCQTPATDATGMVIYHDVVADRIAAKASLYIMKRTETSTAQLENFGFPDICTNYADFCQGLATSLNTTTTQVNTYLQAFENPYCVRRGSPLVVFNSNCQDLSPVVGATPFLPNDSWLSANQFYMLDITIPTHL